MGSNKVISSEEFASMIRDESSVIAEGLTFGAPEELLIALEDHFLEKGTPRHLTIIAPGGTGDAKGKGFDHFAHEGFIRKYSGSYLTLTKKLSRMILDEKVEGYMWPLGVYSQMMREITAGRPGIITHIGLRTFIDPRIEGGRLNASSNDPSWIPELMHLNNREWLFYKTFPIDVALLRGTTADERGNVTLEKEAGFLNVTALAMATKKCGGKVFVQVERLAAAGTLHPKNIKIPGLLVDGIVVAKPENHKQTWRVQYDPARSGEIRVPEVTVQKSALNVRKVIGKRGLEELEEGMVVNIGAGMAESVSVVAREKGFHKKITFVIEAGVIGGTPASGTEFNTSVNPEAIIDQNYMLDFFDGGGCDVTLLGFAQVDENGNVNVTKLKNRITGVGGFLDLAPTAKKRVHCGSFMAGEQEIVIEHGRVKIIKEGTIPKFVRHVEQISTSGAYALEVKQPVLFITERAVFEWAENGLILKEIAPGIDLEKDILEKMEFRPVLSEDLKLMDENLFIDE